MNLTVLRDGKRQNLHVMVGDLAQIFPDRFGGSNDNSGGKKEETAASFGMSIQNLTPAQRDSLGLKQTTGVKVVEIEPNSFAEDVGLQTNDILTEINHKPVNSVDDVSRLKATLKPGDAVAFRVMRKSGNGRNADWVSTFVAGILPNNPQ